MIINSINRYLRNEADGTGDGGGGAGGEVQQQAAAVVAAAPVPFNPDGTFGDGWQTALGDEFSPHAANLANFKNVAGLAKSYLHLQKHGPAYPEAGAAAEDVQRFHALARVPVEGTPTAYGIELPTDASDIDKQVMGDISKVAFENHVPGPALKAIVGKYQELVANQVKDFEASQAAATKAATDDLIGAWRGDYNGNLSTARHMAATLGAQAGIDPADPLIERIGENPALAKIMLQVSKLTSESGIRPPANMGDLRSNQQKAESIMSGKDPVWGEKYTSHVREDQLAAYNEVKRLLGGTA